MNKQRGTLQEFVRVGRQRNWSVKDCNSHTTWMKSSLKTHTCLRDLFTYHILYIYIYINIFKYAQGSISWTVIYWMCFEIASMQDWAPYSFTELSALGFFSCSLQSQHLGRQWCRPALKIRCAKSQVDLSSLDERKLPTTNQGRHLNM